MKIAAVADKVGRVQHNRMLLLQKLLSSDLEIDVFTPDDKINFSKYDLAYYTHFSLYKKKPCNIRKYASVTSHKCLADKKSTIKQLSQFDSVSVNNTILYEEFKGKVKDLHLTPNGVNSKFFTFHIKTLSNPPVFGWVGNRDRETKNYDKIVVPLSERFNIKTVAPSKRDNAKDLLSAKEMRKFYHSIDFFLVTSETEGTPNPGLEAMSCGVPCISTRVGNMIELISDPSNGFFAEPNVESFTEAVRAASKVPWGRYEDMREEARAVIEKRWDWDYASNNWRKFFKQGH